MAEASLLFRLLGEDTSASGVLESVHGKGKAVAAGLSAAFGGMALGDAFTQSMDTESTMATFKAGLGQTPVVAAQAAGIAGDLFKSGIGASLEEVTGAVSAVGTQMLDLSKASPDQIRNITTSATNLAKVMGVDVVDVTKAAGQMMKNGLAPDAETAMNIIATGAGNGANKAGDLLDTLNEYSPQFAKLGVSGTDALGMIKTGMDNGVFSSDLAADAFKEFSIRTVDGSKTTSTAMSSLGLDANTMAEQFAKGGPSAKAATGQVMDALAAMTDPVAQQIAGVGLFGTQWEDAGGAAILAMNPVKQATTDVSGATTAMGQTMQDTAQTKVDSMKRTFEGFMQGIVSAPGPIGTIGTVIAGMGPQGMQMAASVIAAGAALKDLGLVTKIATAVQWLFNIAMDANPITLIIIAVVALVAAFVWLWMNCDGFRQFFIDMWDKIKGAVSAVIDWFKGAWDTVVKWFTDAWQKIKDFVSGVWDGIKGAAQGVWDFLVGMFQGIHNTIWGVIDKVKGFFSSLWDGFKNGAQDAWNFITGIFGGIKDWFGNLFGGIGDAIKGALGFVGNFLKAPINVLIGVFNWFIDQLNKISFDVPSWVPLIGGNHIGISLGHIPQLAEGGVVMPQLGGRLVNVGEAGEAEAIIPLSKMNAGGTTVHVHVNGFSVGSSADLARNIVDTLNREARKGSISGNALAGLAG